MSDKETENRDQRSRPGSPSADGSYRYVRPESKQMLYRDAAVEPAGEEPRMPHHYSPPKKDSKKAEQSTNAASPQSGSDKKHKRLFVGAVCAGLCCALLGGVVGSAMTVRLMTDRFAPLEAVAETQNPTADGLEASGIAAVPTPMPVHTKTPGEIYAQACQQVVGITTEVTYRNLFGIAVSQPVSGTGFFISDDGYVLTNYHVIEYALKYKTPPQVMLHDGTKYNATVVGGDADNDIAVLRIEQNGLTPVTLGNSDGILVGDCVYAIGNPLGELEFSMTTGSVSAMDRLISTQESAPAINMFQIDAAVNQGNSGGPVYDDCGEVIGIVTAKYSDAGIEGLGFAIPINDAVQIATDLSTNGYVTGKAKLGVDAQTMSASAARYYKTVEGAYLRYIEPNSCADRAGLQLGDVIYRFGDLDIFDRDSLKAAVHSYHAGDTVALSVYREGEHLTIQVTLSEDTSTDTEQDSSYTTIAHYGAPRF